MTTKADETGNGFQAGGYSTAIYSSLVALQPDENVIYSPLLVEATLALLYLGSDGQTAEELGHLLEAQRAGGNAKMANFYAGNMAEIVADSETKWLCSSRLRVKSSLSVAEEFARIAQKYFHVQLEKSDGTPAAAGELLTTASFKYKWFLPFSSYRTGLYDFQANSGPSRAVAMLYDEDVFVKFGEFRELDARAIELPYEHDNEMAMLVVLPNRRDGLAELLQQLRTLDLATLGERMQMESVQVLLPKFKIDFECSLKEEVLQKMGVKSIFSSEANFKNALAENCTEPLVISDIRHKLRLEVHELGSEDSKVIATKPIVVSNSIDSKKKFFRADHPFFFAIRSDECTHFVGHVSHVE